VAKSSKSIKKNKKTPIKNKKPNISERTFKQVGSKEDNDVSDQDMEDVEEVKGPVKVSKDRSKKFPEIVMIPLPFKLEPKIYKLMEEPA